MTHRPLHPDRDEDKPLLILTAAECKDPNRAVVIYPAFYGMLRICVCDKRFEGLGAPPGTGGIIRILETYNPLTASKVTITLRDAEDMEKAAEAYARPWNCEGPGGKIRLDTEEKDRVKDKDGKVIW